MSFFSYCLWSDILCYTHGESDSQNGENKMHCGWIESIDGIGQLIENNYKYKWTVHFLLAFDNDIDYTLREIKL